MHALRRHITITLIVLSVVFLTSCASSDSDEASTYSNDTPTDYVSTESGSVEPEALDAEFYGDTATKNAENPTQSSVEPDYVIRTAELRLRVDPGNFESTVAQIRSLAKDSGGYVSAGQASIGHNFDGPYTTGWYTIRIPQTEFEAALAQAETLGVRTAFEVSSQDISADYVDLESRLAYWESQEEFYKELLDSATTIDEMVSVQTQAQTALLNIEQIEGQLRYFDDKTSFSTLTIFLTDQPEESFAETAPSVIADSIETAGDVFVHTIGFLIIATAFIVPLIVSVLILAIIVWLLYLVWNRRNGKKESSPASPNSGGDTPPTEIT